MSSRALSPCTTPGCPSLVEGGHCPLHRRVKRRAQAALRRSANDPSMDAYSTSAWLATRSSYLAHHQWCVDCGQRATQADHVPPRVLLVALGTRDPDNERWLQPRCITCHARKTRMVDAPIIRRWREGEDVQSLCAELMARLERSMQSASDLGGRPGVG